MKTWKLTIEACGATQAQAALQAMRLMDNMVKSGHTRGYTRGDVDGNATGNWEEGPEVEEEE